MRRWIMAVTACLGISVAASAQPGLLGPLKFHAPIPGDKPPLVVGDRFEYWAGDPSGQFIAILPVPKEGLKGARLRVRLLPQEPAEAPPLAEAEQSDPETAKVAFLIRTATLRPGKYLVRAALLNAQGGEVEPAEFRFARTDKRNAPPALPAEGLPLLLEEQSILADGVWPARTGIPLPLNAVPAAEGLALFENGVRVPLQARTTATWGPDGSAQWALLDFLGRYSKGKPAEYRLKLEGGAVPSRARLSCRETADKIVVDTGMVKFEVGRKRFAGIEAAWFDPTGSGRYNDLETVIKGPGGPYLVDGRIIRFEAQHDKDVRVTLEEAGPVRATIRAEGWYVSGEARVEPLCMFVTRISAFAGQPMLRITHHTIITYDTRQYWLADAGFTVASQIGERFRLGADGVEHGGKLPPGKGSVWLHQERYDRFRLVGAAPKPIEGKVSDGWFSVRGGRPEEPELGVALRDIWQKFPKEVEMSRDGITLHFWPVHGRRAFSPEEELDLRNIYKFWCFHQGPLLDLRLPNDYFEKFRDDYASGTFECRPEHALNGNARGVVIANDFAVFISDPERAGELPRRAALLQRDPAARTTPEWNAATGAMGKVAPADRKHFAAMEEAVEKGYLSHTRCIERGKEYGMWNYADTHTYWDVARDSAQLHRVWHNSHYHEMGKTWLMYYRTGSPDLLRWARPSTDHWMNVDTINYADPKAPIKFHTPGAQYHCKGLTHWGAEATGMTRRDGHAGLSGHWVDPDAFLWCWYLDGNPRAREVYQLWADSFLSRGLPTRGTRREANTTLAVIMTWYQATWNPNLLPAIHAMGRSLRLDEPLEKQFPGPMWHPLWITRYYEQTRDPEYVPFILKYARLSQLGDTWTTALGALAYDLSGDTSYLTQHLGRVNDFPQMFFRAPGDPYDWYGVGPGPLGSRWGAYLCWGHLLYGLQKAGITAPIPEPPPGAYPWTPPKLIVAALKPADREFQVRLKASSFGGDLHAMQYRVFAPSGKQVLAHDFKGGGPSSMDVTLPVPADGETGLYRIEVSTYMANVWRPMTDLPAEAALIPNDRRLATNRLASFVMPVGWDGGPVAVELDSNSDRYPCNAAVMDAQGREFCRASLMRPRTPKPVAAEAPPAAWPIRIEAHGPTGVKLSGKCDFFLMADSPETLKTIAGALPPKK